MSTVPAAQGRVESQTHPARYHHWKLQVEGEVATLFMDVEEAAGLREDYQLKLNSYDLGVDVELADAVNRLRFEQPQVKVVVVTSARERVFCAGANIFMLRGSTHPFKVNFCKYTNETRLAIEEASAQSGQKWIAAVNGTASGGGYELALACSEIHLIDDRSSAVSLPEVPFLGVLPGTGGLTRLVDKRMVRRDLADVFSTLAEGVKGRRAVDWKLVDAVHPPSAWQEAIARRVQELRDAGSRQETLSGTAPEAPTGITLEPLNKQRSGHEIRYGHVTLTVDPERRVAELTLRAPAQAADVVAVPANPALLGCTWYPLALFRELDDALVELRFNHEDVAVVLLRSTGNMDAVLEVDRQLQEHRDHWFVRETLLLMGRTLKRFEMTARSIFTQIEPGSCFGGFLFEAALTADRLYMLDDPQQPTEIALSALNGGALPMGNGLGRLAQRFLGEPGQVQALLASTPVRFGPAAAMEAGLITAAPDDLDWEDELRLAVEERVSMSPDALTGMEANLRWAGPETMETKIFGRLSAWQNWIFTRPNATGDDGALTNYGEPSSPKFDTRRT